jgi:hypothetical protein
MMFEGEAGLEPNKDLVIKRHCGVTVWSIIKALNYAGDARNSKVGDLAENLAVGERKKVVLPLFFAFYPGGRGDVPRVRMGMEDGVSTLCCLYQEIATVEAHKRAHAPTVIKEDKPGEYCEYSKGAGLLGLNPVIDGG